MTSFIENAFLAAYDTVAKLNIETGKLIFIKNEIMNIEKNTELAISDFRKIYISREIIHPDDEYMFELYFSHSALKKIISSRNGGLLFAYRTLSEGSYFWSSISMFVSGDKNSQEVLICHKKLSQETADTMETFEKFNRKILKVLKCNLSNGSYRLIRQRESESWIRSKYLQKEANLKEEWLIEGSLIHKEDIERFKHFTNHEFIIDYFHSVNDELSFFYRRKIGGFYKWVRLVITKSTEYSENNKIFTYIIEDIDSVLINLLDAHGQVQYFKDDTKAHNQAEIYHANLTHVLSYITQKYIDFYMIDLKKDLYIMYKYNPETVSGDTPYIGSYSDMSKKYVKSKMTKDQKEHLLQYASPEAFKQMLAHKTSIEFIFRHINGQLVKTICTKLESENGVPTKVICATVPYSDESKLKVRTFGNFDIFDKEGNRVIFKRKQAKELLAYLIDKRGYPVTTRDIVVDILEKAATDKSSIKYVSALASYAIKDLEKAGYTDVIIKEWNSLRINTDLLDCDYYNLLNGDASYFHQYHNEYMKEYSWAEETNAEILHLPNF